MRTLTFSFLAVLAISFGISFTSRAAEKTPTADLFPKGALAYAEFHGLERVIADIEESDLVKLVEEHESYKAFMDSDAGKRFNAGKMIAEGVLGMDLWEAAGKYFGGSMAVGLYPQAGSEQPSVLLVLRPTDPAILKKPKQLLDSFFNKVDERDGVKLYNPKDNKAVTVAAGDTWIALSNQKSLTDNCIDLSTGKSEDTLTKSKNFGKMFGELGSGQLGQLFVDTEMISDFTGGRFGIPDKLDQPMVSLIAGGLLELFIQSPYAAMTLDYAEGEISLTAGISGSPSQLDEAYQASFAKDGEGVPAPPKADSLIGSIAFHRDIPTWYNARDSLMTEASLPGFDKFESGIGAVLPGFDFGQDVLPMFGKNMQFVASTQSYDHLKGAKPGIQLPGFALIMDLDEPELGADLMQLTFQTIVAITNFDGAQKGRVPTLMEADIHNGVKLSTSRPLLKPEGDELGIEHNFQPSAAQVGNQFILSSSKELCITLIDALKDPSAAGSTSSDAQINMQVAPFIELVRANKDNLLAGEVEKGKSLEVAEAGLDAFLTVLEFVDSVHMDSARGSGDSYRIKLTAKLK